MKALIIGAGGFVGKYLIDAVRRDLRCVVCATKSTHHPPFGEGVTTCDLNVLDASAVAALLSREQPDYIFHLAAQSSIARSWKDPVRTVEINVTGALNVLNAVRSMDKTPTLLMVGSGEEYGITAKETGQLAETQLVQPQNIYAATKACQNMISSIFADVYGMHVVMVRPFNHIGPGQADTFVVSDFCHQVARIEAGLQSPVLSVGNLAVRRDFTDVRDVVRAYTHLAQFGIYGETYNVGSGHAVSIEEVLHQILDKSSVSIEIRTDPAKVRPIDVPLIEANTEKIYQTTGWTPRYRLSDTLDDMLAYWRDVVRREAAECAR